jgi:peptidoglycan-associated lipoprotein
MSGTNKKKTLYVMAVFCIGMLALWGCPKKAEISAVPETPREETPAAAATAQHEQKAEAAKPEVEEAMEPIDIEQVVGLQPVYFDYDQSFIRDDAKKVLKANAEWLKAHPQSHIKIEGNCDERGTIEYNHKLGQRRAANAKNYLTNVGIPERRILLVSYGKEKPACTESTERCLQKNRRDEFVVVPTE